MRTFEHTNPTSIQAAVQLLAAPNARVFAGGTDLISIMKDGLLPTERIVDLRGIPGLSYIKEESGEVRIGAMTKVADIATSSLVQQRAPALAQAALLVASPPLRNMGTLGGNLAQKVRCWYYRDADRADCYKRGGSFCYAVFGASDVHAIFDGAACFAVQPSDTAIAVSALDATLVVTGPKGDRVIGVDDFFIGPDKDLMRETALAKDEILTEVRIPAGSVGQPSVFLKAAPRKAIDFARGSVAAMVKGDPVQTARVAIGAVAPTPHRAKEAESFLEGKKLGASTIRQAADLAIQGAKPLASNEYKIRLSQGLVRQALTRLAPR